jgi:lysophospholipase L1-like esterase
VIVALLAAFMLMFSPLTVVVDTKPPSGYVRSVPTIFEASETWLYGDSITVQSWRNLKPSGGLAVDARWGRASLPTATQLRADLKGHINKPDVVIMAVGTNDFNTLTDLTTAVALARRGAELYGYKLIWVNVYTDNRDDEDVINGRIRSGGPLVRVADWYHLLTANQVDGRSPWLSDGVHLNADGAVWRTNLLARQIVEAKR